MSPSCVGGWAFDSAQVTNHAQPVVWFPAIPNLNEMLIHLNGLRYPWYSLRLLRYARYKPQSIAIQSVVVPAGILGYRRGRAALLRDGPPPRRQRLPVG